MTSVWRVASNNRGIVLKHLLSFVLFILVFPSSIFALEILFFDDFEGEMNDAWVMPDGEWVINDGHLKNGPGGLYSGDEQQSDYIISYDLWIDQFHPLRGKCGCYFYLSDPVTPCTENTNGYFVGFVLSGPIGSSVFLSIDKCENGVSSRLGYLELENPIYQQELHLKFGRIGSSLFAKFWREGESEPDWQVSAVDKPFHTGYWMPYFSWSDGWIDNFKVEGFGVISTDKPSWDELKALFR